MSANATRGARARRAAVAPACREGMPCAGVSLDGARGGDGGGGRGVGSHRGLDEAQLDAGVQPRGGRAVSQGVSGSTRGDPTGRAGSPAGILHTVTWHGRRCGSHPATATTWSGAEPGGLAVRCAVLAQALQGAWGQRHVAVLRPCAAPHVPAHAGTGKVGHVQVGPLLQATPYSVRSVRRENGM